MPTDNKKKPMSFEDEIEMLERKYSRKKKVSKEVKDVSPETTPESATADSVPLEQQADAAPTEEPVETESTPKDDVNVPAADNENDSEDENDSDDLDEFAASNPAPHKKGKRKKSDIEARRTNPEKMLLEDLTKATVWLLDERQLFRMYSEGRRRDTFSENEVHYMNIIRPVFDMQFFDMNNTEKYNDFQQQGYFISQFPINNSANAVAILRRPIKKITDISLENIYYIDPISLLKLIDDNMGTGWQGLPLYLQDIIMAGFNVDCTIMPPSALHRPGGIIDRRKEDGYEVLEIARGGWTEAVFVKSKPKMEKIHFEVISDKPTKKKKIHDDEEEENYDDDEELEDEEIDDAEDDEDEDDNENDNEDFDETDDEDFDETDTPIEDIDEIATAVSDEEE